MPNVSLSSVRFLLLHHGMTRINHCLPHYGLRTQNVSSFLHPSYGRDSLVSDTCNLVCIRPRKYKTMFHSNTKKLQNYFARARAHTHIHTHKSEIKSSLCLRKHRAINMYGGLDVDAHILNFAMKWTCRSRFGRFNVMKVLRKLLDRRLPSLTEQVWTW
jgi:hypothetical protein